MDLCDEVYRCLQLLKDDKLVGPNELRRLLSLVCEQLQELGNDSKQSGDDSKQSGDASKSTDILKQERKPNQTKQSELTDAFGQLDHHRKKLFVAIYCLYLETARLNTGLESELNELNSVLEHVAMLDSSRRLLVDTYRTGGFRSNLVRELASLRLDCEQPFIDRFAAIELTKDSVVKSSRKVDYYRHICQTEYLMSVQTAATKHLFTCSIQDIESMSVQFKEIMKTVDRVFTVKK